MTHRFSPHRLALLALAVVCIGMVIANPAAAARKRVTRSAQAPKASCCAHGSSATCSNGSATPATTTAPGQGGLRAFLDPETGQITGSIVPMEPAADARPIVSRESLVPVTMPNGSVMVDLQGTGEEFYVLRMDPFGRRRMFCVRDSREARLVREAALLPPTPTER